MAGVGGNGGRYNYNIPGISLRGGANVSGSFLELNQTVKSTSAKQVVTVTLPKAATCIEFWITDIDFSADTGGGGYADSVNVPGFKPSMNNSSYVTCSGTTCTTANINSTKDETLVPGDVAGAVKYSYSGAPKQSFSIEYMNLKPGKNAQRNLNYQQIYVSPIVYKSGANCTCS